ncbi:transglycosylase family protein [Streptomyces desertarenae]|uniref:Transglycosylase family protein n=2 Tax=Streptomyces desertarenae TaxID=2666184 RepID=A0ABW4PPF6_9ACTN
MTGAGIAMPLLGASGAQAADLDTWDKVAQCESGGLWSADTGNGYYGGLQLTQETWEQYGGTAYAERPDLASRSQQIAVAEKILADQGPDAWPSCGINAGLRHDTTGEAPAIDPGLLLPPGGDVRDAPSDGSGAADGSGTEKPAAGAGEDGSGAEEPADGAGAEGPADGAGSGGDGAAGGSGADGAGADGGADGGADAADDGASAGAGRAEETGGAPREGTGRHRGERDPGELEQERRQAEDGREDGRGTAQEERSAEERRTDRSARAGFAGGLELGVPEPEYRVQPGDSLVSISLRHEVEGGWSELYENNREVVGEDPDLILPGQELSLG